MRSNAKAPLAAVVLVVLGALVAAAETAPRRWAIPRASQRRSLFELASRAQRLEEERQALAREYVADLAEIASDLGLPKGTLIDVVRPGFEEVAEITSSSPAK